MEYFYYYFFAFNLGNNLSNLASSAENFKSLTRIFPHLGKDLSNSLPTNFEQSPNEYTMDLFHSDLSTSSATSSFSRSGIGAIYMIFIKFLFDFLYSHYSTHFEFQIRPMSLVCRQCSHDV